MKSRRTNIENKQVASRPAGFPVQRTLWLLILFLAAEVHAAPISGTWSGDFLGHESVLVLEERNDGSVIGFLATDPNARIGSGLVDGNDVLMQIAVGDPGASASGTFEGTITGNQLQGVFTLGGGAPVPVSFTRDQQPFTVENWLLGEGEIDSRALRLLGQTGAFVSGGYVGIDDCDFLSCAGDFTAWDVAGDAHTITAAAGGGCPMDATLDGNFDDVEKFLVGTYDGADCIGAISGDFIGGKGGLADSKGLRGALKMLADFADDVQAESFAALDRISDGYLNDGKTKAHWESDLAELYGDYDDLLVQIARIDEVVTANDADVNPVIALPPRVQWRLVVTAEPAGGGARETVTDVEFALQANQQLHWTGKQKGRSVFVGNGYAEPFAIDLPIDSLADNANLAYGLWPFGVHGGGHPEGHAGWDVEYTAGAKVLAAADGTVTEITPNDDFPAQSNITLEHRPGISTRYHHVTNLPPAVAVGAPVATGDELGDPGSFAPGFFAAHFDLRWFTDPVCPSDALSSAAQTLFDSIWANAAYNDELTEPFPCQSLAAGFPLTRIWQRTSGGLPPRIDFSRASAASSSYGYVLRNAADAVVESGVASIDPSVSPAAIDLVPDGGGATHLGVYDVVSDQLWIDWDDVARPADLAGASAYQTE